MLYQFEKDKEKTNVTVEDIHIWCEENMKCGEVIVGNNTIYIESKIDAMAFKLRWL